MATIPHKSFEELQRALLRFGDAAFRMCYMHTKSPKETRTLLDDVFTQYFLHVKPFKSDEEERLWVMKTAHRACMDYYAAKLRKKPSAAQIQAAGKDLEFHLSEELCGILNLPYTVLTPLSLCFGDGESTAFAAKVTGRSEKNIGKLFRFASEKTGLPETELTEWIETILFTEDMRSRVLYDIINASKDKHFAINSRAAKLKRAVDHSLPYAALGVICFCILCVVAVRSGWFGYEYIRSEDGGNTGIHLNQDYNSDGRLPASDENTQENGKPAATLSIAYYIPAGGSLTEYICTMEADASVLTAKMAEKGAFPGDVALEDLFYVRNGKVTDTIKSGEQLEVRLCFSEALQLHLDASPSSLYTLEAIARSFHSFYDAANMTLAKLEIYAGGKPVTVNGEEINCSMLLYGELPVAETVEE